MSIRISRTGAAFLAALTLSAAAGIGCGGGKSEKPGAAATEAVPPAEVRTSRVIVEIDRMQGTPEIPASLTVGGREVSLKSIYEGSGVEVVAQQDEANLPRVDRVRLADLHGLMTAFDTVRPPAGVGKVHALVVTADEDDPATLGIMFDFNDRDLNSLPREGFAVFASPHEALNNSPAELLLTTAHELAHCFNLHHADWEGARFGEDATVEGYSMANTVRWGLSPRSVEHLKQHQAIEVWPGQGGLPFGSVGRGHLSRHQSDPAESYSVVDDPTARGVAGGGGALKSLARERSAVAAIEADDLRLVLEAPKSTYVVGEPIVLTVGVHNTGSRDRYVLPLLDPRYQFLNVEIRKPGETEFRAFRSAVLADARGVPADRLKPGDTRHEEIKVFFGADGWTFEKPGPYEVRADFPAGGFTSATFDRQGSRVQSPVLALQVQPATATTDRRVRPQVMRYQEGLFLFLDGASHLKSAKASLERVVRDEPNSAVAASARVALAQAELNPAPQRGSTVAAQPDDASVARAQVYLSDLPTETLPASTVVRATEQLSVEVRKRDVQEADRLRSTARRIEREESAKDRARIRASTTRVQP